MSIFVHMENEEVFKPIEGFEDYEVSNHGNVKSFKRNIILIPNIASGYKIVYLFKNGNRYRFSIHRLVAIAFIPNPDNLPCVNHKDENKLNNHVDNLEWCTYKYNSNYGTAKERIGAKHKNVFNNILVSKPVVAIDDDGNIVYEFASTREAERNGFDHRHISKCCNHVPRHNTHKGLHWYYKEEWLKIIENK